MPMSYGAWARLKESDSPTCNSWSSEAEAGESGEVTREYDIAEVTGCFHRVMTTKSHPKEGGIRKHPSQLVLV
jgi:hypothetical protein